MKNKQKVLDVDFIGGQEAMTKQEEFAISAFIESQKLLHAKKPAAIISKPIRQNKKATA